MHPSHLLHRSDGRGRAGRRDWVQNVGRCEGTCILCTQLGSRRHGYLRGGGDSDERALADRSLVPDGPRDERGLVPSRVRLIGSPRERGRCAPRSSDAADAVPRERRAVRPHPCDRSHAPRRGAEAAPRSALPPREFRHSRRGEDGSRGERVDGRSHGERPVRHSPGPGDAVLSRQRARRFRPLQRTRCAIGLSAVVPQIEGDFSERGVVGGDDGRWKKQASTLGSSSTIHFTSARVAGS